MTAPSCCGMCLTRRSMIARVAPARHTILFHFAFPRGRRSCVMMSTFSGNSCMGMVPRRGGVVNCAAHGDNKIPRGFGGCFIVRFSGPFACGNAFTGGGLRRNGLRRGTSRAKTVVNFDAHGNRVIRTHVTSSFVDFRRTTRGLGRLNGSSFRRLTRGKGST